MATQLKDEGARNAEKAPKFAIYRASDAPDFDELEVMEVSGLTPIIQEGLQKAVAEGASEGNVVRLLFAMPGMSLTYAWFKSGFPLPLHSHNADCLYYIVAGSLKIGTEELSAGDGFFVGCDVPYTYTPGEKGVEVLEFRTADHFDIRFLGKTNAYWEKTVTALRREKVSWNDQVKPSVAA